MSKKQRKRLAAELHERGLRRKLAKRTARALTEARTSRDTPAEVQVVATELRELALELETSTAGVVGEHAEPQRSARAAA